MRAVILSLRKKYARAEFFLILGTDVLRQFSEWREPDEIRRLAGLLVARREPGEVAVPVQKDLKWIDMPICFFSSSKIRQEIRDGKTIGAALPEGVEDYIRRMKLYSGGQPCTSS